MFHSDGGRCWPKCLENTALQVNGVCKDERVGREIGRYGVQRDLEIRMRGDQNMNRLAENGLNRGKAG